MPAAGVAGPVELTKDSRAVLATGKYCEGSLLGDL